MLDSESYENQIPYQSQENQYASIESSNRIVKIIQGQENVGQNSLALGDLTKSSMPIGTTEIENMLNDSVTLFSDMLASQIIETTVSTPSSTPKKVQHQTLLSCMQSIPIEIQDLKEKLAYYQNKLYKMYAVKMDDLVQLEVLGKGASGQVSRVFCKNDRQFYAMKEIKRKTFKKDIYFEACVWNEIQNLLKLTQSQNSQLLKTILIDYAEERESCFLLMEMGKGTLEDFAECKKKYNSTWTEKELEYILTQLIKQVVALKELNICHCDIKPMNIIISAGEDCLKLSDLGSAYIISQEGPQPCNIAGTPHFMSPEIIKAIVERKRVVHHDPFLSDLYSIGVTILTLINPTLKRAGFDKEMSQVVQQSYPNLYPHLLALLGKPEQRIKAISKILGIKPALTNYHQLESCSVGENYKLHLYCKIVGSNKNIETSFYFDMFILEDAFLVIQKQICLLNEKIQPGDPNPEEIIWRIRLARCYYLQTRYEEALKELEKIIERKELKSFDTKNLLTKARILLWLGVVKAKLGRVEESINHLMHCLGVRVAELGEIHEDVSAVFCQLGDTYLSQENYISADKAFKRCIQIGEKLAEKEQKYVAKSYHSLGLTQQQHEKFELALEHFEKAKIINIQIHGETHPSVADVNISIAHTLVLQSRTREGLGLAEKALESKIKWYGKSNPEVAISHMKMAKIYETLGHYQKVHELLEKSSMAWKLVSGADSLEIVQTYQEEGAAMCRGGQYDQALLRAEKVIQIKEKYLGPKHPRIAADYLWHAEICQILGKKSCKQASLKKFIETDMQHCGQNINTIIMFFQTIRLLEEDKQLKEGKIFAERAYEMCLNLAIPKSHKVYSEYHEAQSLIMKAESEYESAIIQLQKAIDIRNNLERKEYNIIANLCISMGNLHEIINQDYEALLWYRKSSRIIKSHISRENVLMAKVLLALGNSLARNNDDAQAERKLVRARRILKNLGIQEDALSACDYRGNMTTSMQKSPID